MTVLASLTLAALLIVGNGFFVGVEFALLASRRTLLLPLTATSRRARTAVSAIERLPLMIATCQFGITLCSIGLGAVGEPAMSRLIEPVFEAIGAPSGLVDPVSFALALLVVAVLHMVVGEMVPKNIALAGPERTAVLLTPALVGFLRVFRLVIVGLTAAAGAIVHMLRVDPVDTSSAAYTPDQVAALVAEARQEGLLGDHKHHLLTGALGLGARTASAVLLPIEQVVTVPAAVTPGEVERLVAETGFSRFPVDEPADPSGRRLKGYLHLADILDIAPSRRAAPLPAGIVRPLPTARLDAPLQDVLTMMQRSGAHLSQVVDGAGHTLGVVALEDVLEELVGEVRDVTRRPRRN